MSKSDALNLAKSKHLDLVLVAKKAKPPVAKIIDFNKFKYLEDKKTKSSGAKSKATDVKEIRFTPFMADNDFETRLDKARDFLNEGHPVKLVVKFVGRQITRKEFGKELMNKAIKKLSDIANVNQEPKWRGKLYMAQLKPNS